MSRKCPSLQFEIQVGFPGISVAGVDEVGRGCLAGPVVAAAVLLPSHVSFEQVEWLNAVKDSKLLSPLAREKLAPCIESWASGWAIGVASVEEIDAINIFHASHLAMIRAVQSLKVSPHFVLVDGKFLPRQGFGVPALAVIQGDQKCLSIAASSILAKVWRDRYMAKMEQKFPGYGFAQHKGYPTPAHQQALKKKGICILHRKSFGSIAALASILHPI